MYRTEFARIGNETKYAQTRTPVGATLRLAQCNAHDASSRGRERGGDDREVLGTLDLTKHKDAPHGAEEARADHWKGDHLYSMARERDGQARFEGNDVSNVRIYTRMRPCRMMI